MFPVTSRYHGIETKKLTTVDGREVVYLKRRFLPPLPSADGLLGEYVVSDGERPDHIAAATIGDPEQFWRLSDANGVMHPDELTQENGRRLRIPLIQGG